MHRIRAAAMSPSVIGITALLSAGELIPKANISDAALGRMHLRVPLVIELEVFMNS